MSEFEQDHDRSCPSCGHSPVHSRSCTELSCEGGYIDDSNEDPLNFVPGESMQRCPECRGTEVETWCPKCGANLSGMDLGSADDAELEDGI